MNANMLNTISSANIHWQVSQLNLKLLLGLSVCLLPLCHLFWFCVLEWFLVFLFLHTSNQVTCSGVFTSGAVGYIYPNQLYFCILFDLYRCNQGKSGPTEPSCSNSNRAVQVFLIYCSLQLNWEMIWCCRPAPNIPQISYLRPHHDTKNVLHTATKYFFPVSSALHFACESHIILLQVLAVFSQQLHQSQWSWLLSHSNSCIYYVLLAYHKGQLSQEA